MPKKTNGALMEQASDEMIARRAYELWERDGCAHGRDAQHWEEAEKQLRGAPAPQGNPAYPSKGERDRIVAANTGRDEPVKKIPASALRAKR